ncbi:ASCH domain-containing protein [Bacillus sp. UNC438CL73TsuS30]|uniref:ASCH domain-containing protein n=1 Tax=Bacillus sp. UNC438CL73TsuS30 TaxID=1340434 RepID=UPI00047BFDB8|nr:ASCH domain-containing protein [Bacillus sp. UNC438CL73TsuS30]
MSKIILSIHPRFVDKIISGEKRYEFRKVKAKLPPEKIFIYSTSPVSQVIGEAEVENILIDTPENLWKITSVYSGIDKAFYQNYYKNKQEAIAYQLKNVIVYPEPKELKEYGINTAPQSFIYV